MVIIDTKALFKRKSKIVPTLENLLLNGHKEMASVEAGEASSYRFSQSMFALPFVHDLVVSIKSHDKRSLFSAALEQCRTAALTTQRSLPDRSDPTVESAVRDLKRNNMTLPGEDVLRTLYGWMMDTSRPGKRQAAGFLLTEDSALLKEKDALHKVCISKPSNRNDPPPTGPKRDFTIPDAIPGGSSVLYLPDGNLEGPKRLATVAGHYRNIDDPLGPIFYKINTNDGEPIDNVEGECLHVLSDAPRTKQPPSPKQSPKRQKRKGFSVPLRETAPKRGPPCESPASPPRKQRVTWDLPMRAEGGDGSDDPPPYTYPDEMATENLVPARPSTTGKVPARSQEGSHSLNQFSTGGFMSTPPTGTPLPWSGQLQTGGASTRYPSGAGGLGGTGLPQVGHTLGAQGQQNPPNGGVQMIHTAGAQGLQNPPAGSTTLESILIGQTHMQGRLCAAQEEANRLAALKVENQASGIKMISSSHKGWYARLSATERGGFMVEAPDATPFAKSVQGVTNINRVKTELALAIQRAPAPFRLATIATKDCILKAIASMELVSHEISQVSPFSLYYVSESFAGTSAAREGMLITRTERALTQSIKALMAINASYFGISSIPTLFLLSWYDFFIEHGPLLSQIRDTCPAHRDIYSELQHEIDSVHSEIAKTARVSQPQLDVVDEAKRIQRSLISGRIPLLKPLPSHILDKVRTVSSQESDELLSFLRPPNPDQSYGHRRDNDQDHRRQQGWNREPNHRNGGQEGGSNGGANAYYGPSGGNPRSRERSNHPQDLITPGRDFIGLIDFGPRRNFHPPTGPEVDDQNREQLECINHVFLRNGCSLPNCPRRCNHTPITAGSDRHRRCINYRNQVLARARDFQ